MFGQHPLFRFLIKQIQINNGSSGAINLSVQVTDTSATATFRIFNEQVAATTTKDIINQTLVLEASDILKMTQALQMKYKVLFLMHY